VYYWSGGDRLDDIEIKLTETESDDKAVEIDVLGGEEETERLWKTLRLLEKGMVPIKGLL